MDTISIREKSPEVPLESTAKCAGCRREFPKEQLMAVHEGHHDNLVFFDGDRMCKPCARSNGVAY